MNNQTILYNQDDKIYLNTALTQLAYSKSRQGERFSEKGVLAIQTTNGWDFQDWNFSGTVSSKELFPQDTETVFLSGTFKDFTTLKDQFHASERDKSPFQKAKTVKSAAMAVSSMQQALKDGITLPINGAGGILISRDFTQILYLPQDLFNTTVTCFGEDIYCEEKGFYINENLQGSLSLQFEQAVICYRALTEKLPFSQKITKLRNEDQKDANFLPIKYSIWGLNNELSSYIDETLKSHPDSNSAFRKITDAYLLPILTFYKEAGLTDSGTLPLDETLLSVIRKSNISHEQFDSRAQKYTAKQQKKISIKRHFRHNSTKYAIGLGVVAVTAIITASRISDTMKKPSTIGLSSIQTLEAYYSGINTMDIVQLEQTTKGRRLQKEIDVISNFYVAAKTVSSYETGIQTISIAEWLNFNNDGKYKLFGLSQLYIDGIKSNLFYKAPAKKEAEAPITEDNGITVNDGTTVTHKVEYYLITDMAEENIEVQTHTDTVTLTFVKNQWRVTDLDQVSTSISVEKQKLYDAYLSVYNQTNGNNVEYSKALSLEFPWIPTTSEILEAYNYMQENW